MTDVAAVYDLLRTVEDRIEKITVDLEMEVGDEDWDNRARGALAAHRICRKRLLGRINAMKGTASSHPIAEAQQRAAEYKKKLKEKSLELETLKGQRANDIAEERLRILNRLDFGKHFMKAARKLLDAETYEALKAEALRAQGAAFERELSTGPVQGAMATGLPKTDVRKLAAADLLDRLTAAKWPDTRDDHLASEVLAALEAALSRAEAAEARVKEMEDVLKPFAVAATVPGFQAVDDNASIVLRDPETRLKDWSCGLWVRAVHFRAARRALGDTP